MKCYFCWKCDCAWLWLFFMTLFSSYCMFCWIFDIPPLCEEQWDAEYRLPNTGLHFFSLHLRNLLYTKKAFCYFFSKPNFLSLTCYKMSHVKKPSMCEVYPFSVKTLQTKQLACSLFKMLLLKAELSRETSYVWSIIQCMWDNNTL